MNSNTLKIIACVTMILDHSHEIIASIFDDPGIGLAVRYPGRIAFPLFVFLMVHGFFKTSSKQRYIIRMIIWGLIMALGSLVLVCILYSKTELIEFWNEPGLLGRLFSPIETNIFWTLGLGLLGLYVLQEIKKKPSDVFLLGPILILVLVLSLLTDYSFIAPLLFLNFYFFNNHKSLAIIGFVILSFLLLPMSLTNLTNFWTEDNSQWAMVLAIPFMIKYNGKKGERNLKYFFYIFYPVHLWIVFTAEYYLCPH